MRVLLDECLPRGLQKYFAGHKCGTVAAAGFSGKSNGDLLALAEGDGWQVLLTMDHGIPHQQNLAGRRISLVILRAKSNRTADLLPVVDQILFALKSIQAGQVVHVS